MYFWYIFVINTLSLPLGQCVMPSQAEIKAIIKDRGVIGLMKMYPPNCERTLCPLPEHECEIGVKQIYHFYPSRYDEEKYGDLIGLEDVQRAMQKASIFYCSFCSNNGKDTKKKDIHGNETYIITPDGQVKFACSQCTSLNRSENKSGFESISHDVLYHNKKTWNGISCTNCKAVHAFDRYNEKVLAKDWIFCRPCNGFYCNKCRLHKIEKREASSLKDTRGEKKKKLED